MPQESPGSAQFA